MINVQTVTFLVFGVLENSGSGSGLGEFFLLGRRRR